MYSSESPQKPVQGDHRTLRGVYEARPRAKDPPYEVGDKAEPAVAVSGVFRPGSVGKRIGSPRSPLSPSAEPSPDVEAPTPPEVQPLDYPDKARAPKVLIGSMPRRTPMWPAAALKFNKLAVKRF